MLGEVAAYIRTIPTRVVPYAASTALTRTAKDGQAAIVAEMPRVFDRPTRYTLNATRLIPATAKSLIATVAVKDQAGGTSTRPESYLLPEVEGGNRSEKRFERALRYQGLLSKNMRAMPGDAIDLDTFGNISNRQIRTVLALAKKQGRSPTVHKDTIGRKIRITSRSDLFVGIPTQGSGKGRVKRKGALPGIYRREGHRIRPLFIFTGATPNYRRRLDFDGVVAKVATTNFAVEFERAASALLARRP